MRSISYTEEHMQIIKNGTEAIKGVLFGENMDQKASLLFCLDRFLDPWFGYDLPNIAEIELLLQQVIIAENPLDIKDDALQLLIQYAWPPFDVLEQHLEKVEPELLSDVQYAIRMAEEAERKGK